MLRYLLFTCLIFLSLFVKSQVPNSYYDSAEGLEGNALKTALHNIIKNHHALSYDSVKIALKITDRDTIDPDKVICFYTGWTYGKDEFGNGSEQWNREHVWSKSHGDFGDNPPEGTDLHQLRPADASVNSAKSNRDFDWGVTQYIDGSGATQCYEDTDSWEPRDEVKGDVARIIFYMATRYEGDNGEDDLEIVDLVNSAPDKEPFYGKLSTLLAWNANDQVDEFERKRNDTVYYHYQHNRNPFIDHPEYVDLIWGEGIIAEPSNHVVNFEIAYKTSTSIKLTWDPNDGNIPAQRYLLLINKTGNFTPPVDGTVYPDDVDVTDGSGVVNIPHSQQNYTWNNLKPETIYYFTIFPYNNTGENADYKTDGSVPEVYDTTDVDSLSSNIIISEVADPADNYKARYVELTNIGDADVDFTSDNWYLCRQANGGATNWGDIKLTGVLRADSVMVVAYNATEFNNAYGFSPDLTSGYISGNGNDGYFLYSNGNHSAGVLVDSYGVVNRNGSGKDWEYEDSRAYRIYSVSGADSVWNAAQWIIKSANVSDMTPKWHHKVVSWNGSVSGDIFDKLNWNQSLTVVSKFKPDASCKLVFYNKGIQPVITGDVKFSVIELKDNAILTVSPGSSVTILK